MAYWIDIPRKNIEDLICLLREIISATNDNGSHPKVNDSVIFDAKRMMNELETLLYEKEVKYAQYINYMLETDK